MEDTGDFMQIMVLDIGGTAIKSAIYQKGILLEMRETPSDAKRGGGYLIKKAKDIIHSYQSDYSFKRIGISTAGQVDSSEGTVLFANKNIPDYTGMRIKDLLEREFLMPVFVENDANAACIGEAVFGAGKGKRQFLSMTIGTGIGGAIFLDGMLYTGSHFSAAEFGGIIVHPEDRDPKMDPFSGCYEKYASTTALVENVRKFYPQCTDGRAVFEHFEIKEVRNLIEKWVEEIINGLVTLIHIFNPTTIILGGGIMEQDYILSEISKRIYDEMIPSFRNVEIKKAVLGNQAGMIGIGAIAENRYSKQD